MGDKKMHTSKAISFPFLHVSPEIMKQILLVVAFVGLSTGLSLGTRDSTTEKSLRNGKSRLKEDENLSPVVQAPDFQSGLVEVKESEIPDGVVVYVLEESDLPKPKGESLSTADNIVFRPLFTYRNRQEALSRRRAANGYRRRYFIQRRPYRHAYYVYRPIRWI